MDCLLLSSSTVLLAFSSVSWEHMQVKNTHTYWYFVFRESFSISCQERVISYDSKVHEFYCRQLMTSLTLFLFVFLRNSLPWTVQPLDHLRNHSGDQYCSCQLRRRLCIQSKLRTLRCMYCSGLFVCLHHTSRRLHFRIRNQESRNQGRSTDSLEIKKTTLLFYAWRNRCFSFHWRSSFYSTDVHPISLFACFCLAYQTPYCASLLTFFNVSCLLLTCAWEWKWHIIQDFYGLHSIEGLTL